MMHMRVVFLILCTRDLLYCLYFNYLFLSSYIYIEKHQIKQFWYNFISSLNCILPKKFLMCNCLLFILTNFPILILSLVHIVVCDFLCLLLMLVILTLHLRIVVSCCNGNTLLNRITSQL